MGEAVVSAMVTYNVRVYAVQQVFLCCWYSLAGPSLGLVSNEYNCHDRR